MNAFGSKNRESINLVENWRNLGTNTTIDAFFYRSLIGFSVLPHFRFQGQNIDLDPIFDYCITLILSYFGSISSDIPKGNEGLPDRQMFLIAQTEIGKMEIEFWLLLLNFMVTDLVACRQLAMRDLARLDRQS